ncbi:hypothetical protein QCA50_003993 [Cerrena zonata]|uniref:Copper transport protein n=1 Tax=Cerrena zonata TaxID=2478898 RepID=A0AAW0GFP1_9APHY
MNHGDHGGHDMPMQKCSMNMLWNTQIENTCIVFRSWHISSNTAFVFSCFAIVVLGILYEWLRQAQGQFDVKIAATLSAQGKGKAAAARSGVSGSGRSTPEVDSEEAGLLTGVRNLKEHTTTPLPVTARASRAVLYGAQVFLSFFLMLVFMTYNAYLILAVVIGAAIGHFVFNPQMDLEGVLAASSSSSKGMACH